jgi:glycosyltransferase involved in cell wall biosynthesis
VIPLVSVVIPSYNYGRYLPDAIDSVIAQTFTDFEIIVVDDGSTDETPDVVRHYGERVIYRRQENVGLAATRNNGCAIARGEYFALLDADDAWFPDKLAKQVEILNRNPDAGLVYGRMALMDGEGRPLPGVKPSQPPGETFAEIVERGTPPPSTFLIRRRCFEEIKRFDPSLTGMEDLDLALRLAKRYRVVHMPDLLGRYRDHADSLSHQRGKMTAGYLRMFEKCLDDTQDPALRRVIRRRMAPYHYRWAKILLRDGETAKARREVREALACFPRFSWSADPTLSLWRRLALACRPLALLAGLYLVPRLVREKAVREGARAVSASPP